ncbi:hypothetical protein J7W19_24125 [Streptomyces mobaraensis NBRC 13819 = DSM 40847]|uniref:Uncharacterized protein n=2 Tax=Streptomyces mobaraensis TaxID=35621 RepID=A0A5N5W7B2_STRMB|nr:hypothetical protein [Streptomyces mobaraensis]EME99761.1 hypothetical protein H340_14961 [Streptomyces mobaraensis NBRC 13819 = DSM 40847]KAB7844334.1 hypothetical protein FRZ00_15610 [Streptomyces mobaraensis]QTT76051.1 hypothetical protein J7W19_24125 [Streptomyces mobaraensis NBRC 13819 = DSM 40847]
MDEHPVIRFTNELMVVSELDQRTAGAFVRSVYQEGAREGEQRVIVELHRRDRRIAELEGELARLRGEDGETAG